MEKGGQIMITTLAFQSAEKLTRSNRNCFWILPGILTRFFQSSSVLNILIDSIEKLIKQDSIIM